MMCNMEKIYYLYKHVANGLEKYIQYMDHIYLEIHEDLREGGIAGGNKAAEFQDE